MNTMRRRVLRAATVFLTSFAVLVQPVLAEFRFRVPLNPIATGAEAGGELAYSETSHSFGTVPVGGQATHRFNVTNTGASAITLQSITASGMNFSVSSTCGAYLAPGSGCAITARYAPTTSGASTGSVTVRSDDVVAVNLLPLSGRGLAGTLAGSGYTFPDARQVGDAVVYHDARVTNVGASPVQVSGVSVTSGEAHFSQSNDCGSVIAVGASCMVRIGFAPASEGTLSGSIAITSDSDESPLVLPVQGEARRPSGTLTVPSFGVVQLGTTANQTATLTNTGMGTLTVSGMSVTGADYRDTPQGTSCASTLAPGASCSFVISFIPMAVGPRPGQASVTTNAGALFADLDGVGSTANASLTLPSFGDVLVGSAVDQEAVLSNTGIGTIFVGLPTVSGSDFSMAGNTCGAELAAGESCNVTVRLLASSAGSKTGSLSVETGAGTKTAALSGTGIRANLTLSPTTIPAFGSVQVGDSKTSGNVTLTNGGSAPASGVSVSANSAYTLLSSTCGAVLEPGASCAFAVRFAPTAAQSYNGTLSVTAAAPTMGVSASLSGSGAAQAASLTDVAFGARDTSSTTDLAATLANDGVGPLSVTVPTSSSVAGAEFSFVATTCGATLPQGGTCTVTVRFAPSSNALRTGTLTVATGAGTKVSTISGTGQRAVLQFSPATLPGFGSVQVGQSADSALLTLSNVGNKAANSLALTPPPGYSVQGSTCASTLNPSSSCTLTVRFSPTAVQDYTGALVATGGGSSASASLTLAGTGVGQGATLADVAFGSRNVGTATDLAATLTNTGSGPLSVTPPSAASVTGTGFSFVTTTCGSSVPAGSSCTVTVRYAPSSAVAQNGTLSVATGAGTKTAGLTGSGTQAVLAFSPSSLAAFPTTQVGQSASSSTVTLSNSGNASATGLSLTTPAGYSLQSSTCGATLSAGASCSFAVRFSPPAAQTYAGNVAVAADAPATTPTLAVSGAGAEQSAGLTDVAFGPRTTTTAHQLTSTLTNEGIGPLSITVPASSSVSGAGFGFVSTTCGASLAVGATCSVTVAFTPSANGAYSGALSVVTGAGTKTATLSGSGVSASLSFTPSSLAAFGNVQVGQTADSVSVTVRNTGDQDSNSFSVAAPSGYSIQSSTCGASLAAQASCSFQVRFSPSAAQSYGGILTATGTLSPATTATTSANLALSGIGVGQAATLSDVAFGSRAVGSSTDLTATLTNTGVGPLSVTVPNAASVSGSGYAFTLTSCRTSLAIGESCTVTVRFTPTSAVSYTGALSFATGAGTLAAVLTGQGLQGGALANPGSLSFVATQVGETSTTQAVTFTNNGNTSLNITGVSIATGSTDYGQSNGCGTALGQGNSCTINVAFTPSAVGSRTGTLAITHDGPGGFTTIPLSGTGQAASASINNIGFGAKNVGTTTDFAATVTNTGIGPVTLTLPDASSVTGADFNYVSTTCTTSLPAAGTCKVTVRFTPSGASGARAGTLAVSSSVGTLTSALSGTNTAVALGFTPSTLSGFGSVQVGGASDSATVTLKNGGNITASGLAFAVPSGFSVTSSTCGTSLAANGTCTFVVRFAPTAAQSYSGNVTASSTSAGTAASLAVTGEGTAPSAMLSTPGFQTIQVGDTATGTATLTNAGYGAISVTVPTASSVTGTGFTFDSTTCTASLAASDMCTVTVRFLPTTAGTKTGTLTVVTSAGTKTAPLSAVGQAPSYNANPGTLATNFPPNTQSGKHLRVTNTGLGDILFSSGPSATTGWAPYYDPANSAYCTTRGTLVAGDTCIIAAIYLNNQPAGSYTGTLTIPSSAGTISIALSAGVKGTLSAANVAWGNVAVGSTLDKTVTISNTADYTVNNLTLAAAAPFSIVSDTCGATLAANSTCTATVRFTPTTNATYNSQYFTVTGSYFRVINDAVSASMGATITSTAALSGTGTRAVLAFSPSTLAGFGTQTVNTSTNSSTVTLTNSGNVAASTMTLTAPTGYSLQSNTCSTSLGAGASCTFIVRFLPTAAQAYSGSVSVTAASPAVGDTLAVSGTGVAAAVINTAAFTNNAVSVNKTTPFSWTTTGATTVSLACSGGLTGSGTAVDGSATITAGATVGTGTCTITAKNAANDAVTKSDTISIVALPTVNATMSPTTVTTGSSTTLSWTTTGATSVSYSCTAPASGSASGLAASGSASISTTGTGTGTCTVTAKNAANDSATDPASVTVNPAAQAFSVSGPSTTTWTFTNTNAFAVTPSSVSRTGTGQYTAQTSVSTSSTCKAGTAVPANGTCTVILTASQPSCSLENYTVWPVVVQPAGTTNGAALAKTNNSTCVN